jgi:YVTN family beta-propeller protein
VQVVLLPPANATQFPGDQENQTRSRELASLAYVPGTSLVLSADENDDVVRVIDVSSRQVTRVIALAKGANPDGIAVNAAGTLAVVAEAGRGKAAIIDLKTFAVITEFFFSWVDRGLCSCVVKEARFHFHSRSWLE